MKLVGFAGVLAMGCQQPPADQIGLAASSRPSSVAVSGQWVYWIDEAGLWRIDRAGSDQARIYEGPHSSLDLFVDDEWAYWLADSSLWEVSLYGPETAGETRAVVDFAVTGGEIFWSDLDEQAISSRPVGTTAARVVAKDQYAFGVAVSDGYVYWSRNAALSDEVAEVAGIWRVPVQGGEPERIAVDVHGPRWIAVGGQMVFWTNSDSVMAVEQATGEVTAIAGATSPGSPQPYSPKIEGEYLYWAQGRDGRGMETVWRAAIPDGSPELVHEEEGRLDFDVSGADLFVSTYGRWSRCSGGGIGTCDADQWFVDGDVNPGTIKRVPLEER